MSDKKFYFQTQFRPHPVFYTEPGSKFVNEYGYDVIQDGENKGQMNLVVKGKTNVFEKIQADKDSCDINLIIQKFTAGDTTAFDRVKSFYLDTTDFPENYADFLQKQADGQKMFDHLDPKYKEMFNNDAGEFWSQFGSNEWVHKLGLDQAQALKVEAEKVNPVQHIEKKVEADTPAPADSKESEAY